MLKQSLEKIKKKAIIFIPIEFTKLPSRHIFNLVMNLNRKLVAAVQRKSILTSLFS